MVRWDNRNNSDRRLSPSRREKLHDWLQFVVAESHILKVYPELFWQQAANQPKQSFVSRHTEELRETHRGTRRPWLRWINRPDYSARLLTLTEHTDTIARLAMTPDGKRLISVSKDGAARVWDYESGRLLFDLAGHESSVNDAVSDGRLIATGGSDGTITIWNAATGEVIKVWRGDEEIVTDLALSPDGSCLASSGPRQVTVWDIESGNKIAALEGREPILFSTEGRYLVHGGYLYDFETGSDTYSGGERVAFSADGHLLASATEGMIFVKDKETLRILLVLIGHTHWIGALAFTPDRKHLISTGKHGDIKIWNANPGAHHETVELMKFEEIDEHGNFKVFQAKKGNPLHEIEAHQGMVTALVALPDNSRFLSIALVPLHDVTCGEDYGIKVWDVETGSALGGIMGHGDPITAFTLTPDFQHVVTGDVKGTIRVWDIEKLEHMAVVDSAPKSVFSVAVTPDCRYIIADHRHLGNAVYDAASGLRIEDIDLSTLISKNSHSPSLGGGMWQVALANDKRTLQVQRTASGDVVARFIFPEDIRCIDACGAIIAAGGDGIGDVYILEFQSND